MFITHRQRKSTSRPTGLATRQRKPRSGIGRFGIILMALIYLSLWAIAWGGYQASSAYESRLTELDDQPFHEMFVNLDRRYGNVIPRFILESPLFQKLKAPYLEAVASAERAHQQVTSLASG